jgi:adenylyl-sulfate kinase
MKNNKESIFKSFELLNNHKTLVIWLSGLSGAGKSTLASAAQEALLKQGLRVSVLDGDILRKSLCSDLGFSQQDRSENLRRVAEVAKILSDNGNIVICSFISPLKSQRDTAQRILKDKFCEVFINSTLAVCEKRDTKGLYKKARSGEILNFTGISSKFEDPTNPHISINTEHESIKKSTDKLVTFINQSLLEIDCN